MKFRYLKPEGNTAKHFMEAVARARGATTKADVEEFLAPLPTIRNNISHLPEYAKASCRLHSAFTRHERVIIFGDWDCDGILSLILMQDLARTAGHEELHWFIPDRRSDDYGLTMDAVQRCYELHKPDLIVTVDCGSPSHEAAGWLKERGVDTIVIDHHQLGPNKGTHPAVAHLNPKACLVESPEVLELREMSASGLAYLFCEQFVQDHAVSGWDRDRALILGGVGTVVDVMKLVGVNRALAKWALKLASNPEKLARVPGLVALHDVARGGRITASTFGFIWGPRLNATGRLEEATAAVRLLMADTVEDARSYAVHCHNANADRRQIQSVILDAALTQADQFVKTNPEGSRVLVLFDQSWHPGVVGIVASRVKEQYARPTVVLGWHDDGFCKGSGRSVKGYNMGTAIQAAAAEGVILGGGGHPMAAGMKLGLDQVEQLRVWLNENCRLSEDDLIPDVEVLGRCESLTPDEWCDVFDSLEPFGNGNPKPSLYLQQGELVWGPREMVAKGSNSPWALKAGFKTKAGNVLFCVWTDVLSAQSRWARGRVYGLALSLSRTKKDRETYLDWRVNMCEEQ